MTQRKKLLREACRCLYIGMFLAFCASLLLIHQRRDVFQVENVIQLKKLLDFGITKM